MRKVDVSGPLAHFQSVEADKEGTLSLLQAMNAVMTRLGTKPLPEAVLGNALNLWWPQLEASLTSASALEVAMRTEPTIRTPDQMLQELVESTRGISNVLASLAEKVDASQPAKPAAPKQIAFETEVLDAARATLRALTAEVENEDTNPSMDRAIWGWQAVAADSTSTLEALNDAIRRAKSLRAYFNR